ncbi:hypothetical protein P175DRAFT_0440128 [Aspergillus ochraceoroseus IBT 24754]|uniref:Serine hydrolase domain-containing protein n=2 Tax=Aspergillus ochraceoroseus TaxID=138278 RepID=A0A2T5LUC1_9EURO|nr:uncharacterized protein P175DRAFT_0440128 [Aspergillus ochraceoroseus IBT 24754]KKK20745.1 hypothetical protein AOCH_006325 [Aspergillus ochraceoroseus]PTU19882.1 hypothetical protein P175DRAFT_0440128 [Aspergillus ochraceoroseus IBT 24754]
MKVLCLHGRGTSGAIFRSQLSSIRSRLSDLNLEFDYVDGQYPCGPAPGIDLFYPPPYYSYTEDNTLEAVYRVRSWLTDLIAERGPYDLVLTFSQGCAVAAGMLLLHESEAKPSPQSPQHNGPPEEEAKDPAPPAPPFKAAVFICGGASIPILEHIGYHIAPAMRDRDAESRVTLSKMADSSAILSQGSSRWVGLDVPEFQEEDVRKELVGDVKISIPTVHVYGSRDPRYVAGIQLSEACTASKRKVYNHGGGHEIPRFEAVSRTIADLVRWALKAGGADF